MGWLSEPGTAMASVIVVNVWRGFPFFGISFLAGMKAIPAELYEAAAVDGANAVQRFRHVTLPGLRNIVIIVMLLSTIWTFNDFAIVYILTKGGPGGATKVLPVFTYEMAFGAQRLGEAIAVALYMLPGLGRHDRRPRPLHAARARSDEQERPRARCEGRGAPTACSAPCSLIVLFPFYWMTVTSFKSEDQMRSLVSMFWPTPVVFDNYHQLLAKTEFVSWSGNSVVVVGLEHARGHRHRHHRRLRPRPAASSSGAPSCRAPCSSPTWCRRRSCSSRSTRRSARSASPTAWPASSPPIRASPCRS